jgi:putative sigma-54 modulation protein
VSQSEIGAPTNPLGFERLESQRLSVARKKISRSVSLDFPLVTRHPVLMNLILSTHNLTLTKAIEDHIISRINKLAHLNRFAVNARVTLEHDQTKAPERQFSCSVRLSLPGPDLFAEDVESDLYAAIDLVTKKLEQQIRKRHNKFIARKHKQAARTKRTRQEAGL